MEKNSNNKSLTEDFYKEVCEKYFAILTTTFMLKIDDKIHCLTIKNKYKDKIKTGEITADNYRDFLQNKKSDFICDSYKDVYNFIEKFIKEDTLAYNFSDDNWDFYLTKKEVDTLGITYQKNNRIKNELKKEEKIKDEKIKDKKILNKENDISTYKFNSCSDIFKLDRVELITLFSNFFRAYYVMSDLEDKKKKKENEIYNVDREIKLLRQPIHKPELKNYNRKYYEADDCYLNFIWGVSSFVLILFSLTNLNIFSLIWNVFLGYIVACIICSIIASFKNKQYNRDEFEKDLYYFKHSKKDMSEEITQQKKLLVKKQEELDNINYKIKHLTFDGIHLFTQIHNDYCNFSTIQIFSDYLKRGRCDNFKECINLYIQEKNENDRHQELMAQNERIASEITNENERRFKELENSMSLHDYVNESKVKDLQDRVNSLNSSVSSMEWNNFWNKYK